MVYDIYTDGSCKGNPGPGGIGAVVYKDGEVVYTFSQGYYNTTNNRMEMRAVIEVLKKYGKENEVKILTDSEYVRKGILEWMSVWKKNGWVRLEGAKKKPIKNIDLWKELDVLVEKDVKFEWVKGHAGIEGNESADAMASLASSRGPFIHDIGFK